MKQIIQIDSSLILIMPPDDVLNPLVLLRVEELKLGLAFS